MTPTMKAHGIDRLKKRVFLALEIWESLGDVQDVSVSQNAISRVKS